MTPLPVLNPKAAGLDIGSEEIGAAVPPDCDVSLVRDVLRIPGQVQIDAAGQVISITLQGGHPFAARIQAAFANLPWQDDM